MLILKRLAVWILERIVEACLLGGLLGYFVYRSHIDASFTLRNWFLSFWALGFVAAAILFVNGYYVTTAFFGVIWRSAKPIVYPAIVSTLFIFHTHIVFMRAGKDLTPEARAMEFPFVLEGAAIVFGSAHFGSWALRKWTNRSSNSNVYLSAIGLAFLLFTLANIANYLRPVVGDTAFRLYGVPFTFYREGGFVKEWIWQPGEWLWRGLVADLAVIAAVVFLLGRALKTLRAQGLLRSAERQGTPSGQ